MKTITYITIAMLVLSVPVAAQLHIFQGASSAGTIGDSTIFNVDFFDPIGIPGYSVEVHYKGADDDAYTTAGMELMLDYPYYPTTYKHTRIFNQSQGLMNFYFSAGTDTFKATQSPKNVDEIFPPPAELYASFAYDATGDAIDPLGQWLDLTHSGMCYSDDKVYGFIENATGTWPTNQMLDFFIYGLGFVPDNIQDTVIFAMVYGNIPLVISPGIYKLSLSDTSFSRLGDVDYEIGSDGLLHLSGDIADFESDPEWPGWPSEEGFLLSSAVSVTFGLSSQSLNDYIFPTIYEPRTNFVDFDNNTTPEITSYNLDFVPGLTVTATASYYDADNNLPTTRMFLFDWGYYEMGSFDHTYNDTADFLSVLEWPGDGWHYYYFQFSDGGSQVQTVMDSVYLTSISVDEEENLPAKLALDQNYPNPFNMSTNITYNIDKTSHINLTIYNILGNPVVELVNDYASVGAHSVTWDGTNSAGDTVSSGLYFYQLKVDNQSIVRKMNLIK